MKLSTKILIGMVVGAVVGVGAKILDVAWLLGLLIAIEPIGLAFINLIMMVVVPMVAGSLLVGIASLGDIRKLGRIGGKTIALFLVTTVISASIGLTLALTARPAMQLDAEARAELAGQFESLAQAPAAEAPPNLVDTLVDMIPRNPFAAAAQMDLLPLIIAIVIFGAAINMIPADEQKAVITFFKGVNSLCIVVIRWAMRLAPPAVFVLIAAAVARFGVDLLEKLLVYSLVVAAGLTLQVLGTFSILLRFLARTKIVEFYRRAADALLLAFSTSSSNAALPVSLDVTEKKLGVSKEVTSFVIPLGATLNMNGSALYKAVTAIFIAQVYGVTLGVGDLITVVITATMAAVAGVGVPGSSLVTTLIVLNAVGLGPFAASGIALVLGVERLLDMLRTTVNVTGDIVCATVIARGEGEEFAVKTAT
jgi:Na+/H+-dicarboxylate symporter